MFNYAMSIAAFAFVAFVLAFVRPASQAGHAAAQQAAPAGSAVAANVIPVNMRPDLAASK